MRSSEPRHWGGTRAQVPGRLRAQENGNSLLGLLRTCVREASVTSSEDATEACTSALTAQSSSPAFSREETPSMDCLIRLLLR